MVLQGVAGLSGNAGKRNRRWETNEWGHPSAQKADACHRGRRPTFHQEGEIKAK